MERTNSAENKLITILKTTGSVLLAVIASSHHWLHTLFIALGLTTLGTELFSVSPWVKIFFLLLSILVSVRFLQVSKRRWTQNRPVAAVYLVSSIISIILVLSAIPQTISDFNQLSVTQQGEQEQVDHERHHSSN